MPNNQLDLSGGGPAGPFSQYLNLAAPYRAPEIRPSGWMGKTGKVAFFASQFLEGLSQGKAIKYAREEAQKNQNLNRFLATANLIRENPNLTPEQRTTVDQTMLQVLGRGVQGALGEEGGKGKGKSKGQDEGPIGHFKSLVGSFAERFTGGPHKPGEPLVKDSDFMNLLQVSTQASKGGLQQQIAEAQTQLQKGIQEEQAKVGEKGYPEPCALFANQTFMTGYNKLAQVAPDVLRQMAPLIQAPVMSEEQQEALKQLRARTGLLETQTREQELALQGYNRLRNYSGPPAASMVPVVVNPQSGTTVNVPAPESMRSGPGGAFYRLPVTEEQLSAIRKYEKWKPTSNAYMLDRNGNSLGQLDEYLPNKFRLRGTEIAIDPEALLQKGITVGPKPPTPKSLQRTWTFNSSKSRFEELTVNPETGETKPALDPKGNPITRPYRNPPDPFRQAKAEMVKILDNKRRDLGAEERNYDKLVQAIESDNQKYPTQNDKNAAKQVARDNLEKRKKQIEEDSRQMIDVTGKVYGASGLMNLLNPPDSREPAMSSAPELEDQSPN